MAAHLASRPSATAAGPSPAPADAGGGNTWWEQAIALTPHLVAAGTAPEPARLVSLVFGACPPERAGELGTRVRTALGAPPPSAGHHRTGAPADDPQQFAALVVIDLPHPHLSRHDLEHSGRGPVGCGR
jgi:hypothetical protein